MNFKKKDRFSDFRMMRTAYPRTFEIQYDPFKHTVYKPPKWRRQMMKYVNFRFTNY